MNAITPQLPTVFGASAAMLIAFLALLNGASPSATLMKALAAFLVFAGFGLILRYALLDAAELRGAEEGAGQDGVRGGGLDMIVPGTSVAELLASQPGGAASGREAGADAQAG